MVNQFGCLTLVYIAMSSIVYCFVKTEISSSNYRNRNNQLWLTLVHSVSCSVI